MRLLTVGLLAMSCNGQHANMLVTSEWLAEHLKDPKLVILHVGGDKDYGAGHIPGARLVRLSDISTTGPQQLRLELPPLEQLLAALSKLGVSNDSRVVVYPANDSIQSATRVWFTFDYLGLAANTSLLDGGLAAWKAENRALSAEPPNPVELTTLQARANPDLVVDAQWLKPKLKTAELDLIDARLPEYWNGTDRGAMPRAGRLPGARNIPYPEFLEGGKWKSASALKILMGPLRGQIVTYCHIGQQATVPYFVARYLGLSPKLYDGSYQDWSAQPDLPIEQGGR